MPCFLRALTGRKTPCARTLAGAAVRRLAPCSSGRTPDNLRRQLLASHPEIPAGYDLADFQDLQRHLEMVSGALSNPRNSWLSPLASAAFGIIEVDTRRLSVWEARLEILRRAIAFLGNR